MRIIHYAPVNFEPWDFRTPDVTGIGGSETAVIETARILASRGHEVIVYAPVRPDCPEFDRGGARWLPLESADFTQDGLWILHRCPSALDSFPDPHPGQTTWLVCQDVFYPPQLSDGLTPERSAKLDRCLHLCDAQGRWLLEKSPELDGKLVRSSNGVRLDVIRESQPVQRDPFRIIYTSSPDRGLASLLKIYRRAREWEPRLNLVAAYGFDNIDKCEGDHWKKIKAECQSLMDQPGVRWLGRLPQRELYREFLSAGMWVYPTAFTETSCITCMEAQALGAIPITNPLWALADNVRHGTFVHGDPANDPLCRARYVGEVLRLARDHGLQDSIRAEMMPWARQKFNWERVVDDWEGWGLGHADCTSWYAQYAFQLRHARGRVLNVGCNCDLPGFGKRGGVNIDLHAADPFTHTPNAAHVIADAREPLPVSADFDTVILGDILEHMTDDDAVHCLENAARALGPGGRLVVTCPEDRRADFHPGEYAPGVSAGHADPVTRGRMNGWLAGAGLSAVADEPIEYGHCQGRGVVAEVAPSST